MAYSVYLADALLNHPEYYDIVASRLDDLLRAGRCFTEIVEPDLKKFEPVGELLQAIALYAKAYNKLPDRKGATDYAVEIMAKGPKSGFADAVKFNLEKMDEILADARRPPATPITTDIHVLIDTTITNARKLWHQQNGKLYSFKANGSDEIKEKGVMRPTTPDDAIAWLRKQWTRDFRDDVDLPHGKLHENTEILKNSMQEMTHPLEGSRILTQWSHIDNRFVISYRDNPYIGISAYSNQCKSTMAMTMAFNFWQQGLNIIYVTLEHSPLESWQKFAFLVSGKYNSRFELPPLQQWKMHPESITPENQADLDHIIEDLKNRKYSSGTTGVKQGQIDFQEFRNWDEIVGYLETENRRERVDALFIDYIGDLDTPGVDAKGRDTALNELFRQGQVLTRTFDNGRGIILVSPLQIKKSAYDSAKKVPRDEMGAGILPRRYTLDAVSMYSVAIQRMDVIFALYMDDPILRPNEVEMHVIKVRNGVYPEARMMDVDKFTREVYSKADNVDRVVDAIVSGNETDIMKCLEIGV